MLHAPTRRRALAAGLALAALPGAALAAFPDRPIRWLLGYAPGGGSDTIARIVGGAMAARLGQPVVVENRPGAATNIAAEAAAKAPADGHTVLTADNGTLVFNPALFRRLPYDADRDFRGLGLFARLHLVVAVKQDSTLRDARAFLAHKPPQPPLDYASPGVGSPHHLTMERLVREAGLAVNHVPYRGAAPALNDLLAGTVESMMVDYATGAEYLRSGRVRPLAVCSAARLDALPDVPTFVELGVRGFEAYAWQALVAPTATPDPIAAQLSAALLATMRDPAIRNRLSGIGIEPLDGDPTAYAALLARDRAVWVPLIRELGITLDT